MGTSKLFWCGRSEAYQNLSSDKKRIRITQQQKVWLCLLMGWKADLLSDGVMFRNFGIYTEFENYCNVTSSKKYAFFLSVSIAWNPKGRLWMTRKFSSVAASLEKDESLKMRLEYRLRDSEYLQVGRP